MYKIGEVAELTGMGIHTLRYYEKLGLLPHQREIAAFVSIQKVMCVY